ncbi:hypothetical protein PISL3812_07230 [Talaromyces islandicus]|uniref:Uncharacterized protein n=1 Tax=Talaromyces islandicus TaxID=28573 RepID=A0A0U1M3P4_TALIS|nr:hypothetical protein PISL3812_07230 [Talaromyces islandicus]
MSDRPTSPSAHLEPPHKGVEVEDPGAQESASEEEDHFSDASEGRSLNASRAASPVPRTRVEKVDDEPRHGEVPGTPAYNQRGQDAVPDEVEVVPEGSRSRSSSRAERPFTPGGTPIPQTIVSKVDETPSYGDVPGTPAYDQRKADAVPDIILKMPGEPQTPSSLSRESSDQSVPETKLSRVDTLPKDPTSPMLRAHRRSPSDALPDFTETVEETPGDDDFGDDFDEFEEGENNVEAEDDFGDFDEGFEEPTEEAHGNRTDDSTVSMQPPAPSSLLPIPDFNATSSLSDLLTATNDSLDTLFPETKEIVSLPPLEPIPDQSAIFSSERSLSLWSQLVAPPPLQPPNWVKSRIRRLFLVSLGVPVDLDEILPASKQKKLILPSIDFEGSGALSKTLNKTKQSDAPQNDSTTSVNSTGSRQKHGRRRGPPPPPELDLSAVRRMCSTTDAALDGFTDVELQSHVVLLETTTAKATDVFEYWRKKTDGLIGEKEAFEGVIENMVTHARRVRK